VEHSAQRLPDELLHQLDRHHRHPLANVAGSADLVAWDL
jgi:hypothetical protein